MADYYALLKIKRDATQDEVKRVYRCLAREMHPDVNPDPETQEKFKEITQAYEVLSDVDKRRMYDLGQDPYQKAGSGSPGGFIFSDISDIFTYFANLEAQEKQREAKKKQLRAEFDKAMAGKSRAEKLHIALCVNGDAIMADALLAERVKPDQKTLEYTAARKGWSEWTRKLVKKGARPTADMLHTALIDNRDGETTDALLLGKVVAHQKTLEFAVENKWSTWTEKLVKAGAQPTADLLHMALIDNRDADTTNALLLGKVVPDEKTIGYVTQQGWTDWENKLKLALKKNKRSRFGILKLVGLR